MSQGRNQMMVPQRNDIPFFAYGIFKPGQLGYLRISDLVRRIEPDLALKGTLLERDGLPIFDGSGGKEVIGFLLHFHSEKAEQAYVRIAGIEPENQYVWCEVVVGVGGRIYEANVLHGRSPMRGSVESEDSEWDGRRDPLFSEGLVIVEETLEQNQKLDSRTDMKPFFHLQMAYLLLWSAIERYVSLRYHLGKKVTEKVNQLAKEEAFRRTLKEVVEEQREVRRADKPTEKARLDPSDSKKSIEYYYQIRSNVAHRGKTVWHDFDNLRDSLEELLTIFKDVLKVAFEMSGS